MHPFHLLTVRRFLPLFITQFLGALNDNIIKNALVILITYKVSQLSSSSIELLIVSVSGIFILPFFLFSAISGQIADKYNKTTLIRMVKMVEIGIILLAVIGFHQVSISLLLLVIFLMGTHSTFFGPLKYALLPEHLQEDELVSGNSFIEAGTFIAILIGTLLGGLLILAEPYGTILLSIVAFAAAIGGLVSSYYIPQAIPIAPDLKINPRIFAETLEVLRYTAKDRHLFLAILGISWFWFVGATFLAQFPGYTKNVLHGEGEIVTLFLTIFSLGIGLGSFLCTRLLGSTVSIIYLPAAALGITLFGVALSSSSSHYSYTGNDLQSLGAFLSHISNWRILFDLAGIAVCGGIYIVPLYAFLQQQSESGHRARVIAANNIINSLFMVASAIIIGIMLMVGFSIPAIFFTVAMLNSVVALYIIIAFPETLLKSLLKRLLVLLYKVEIKGMEHYEAAGERVLIIANHTSFLDAPLLAIFLPSTCVFAVNSYIARLWWMRPLLGMVTALPVDPLNPMSTKTLIDAVKKDQKAVIFPEGRITVTGSLMKIYEGPGLIADKAEAMLLPIRIDGAQHTPFSRMKHFHKRWFPKITITILPPKHPTIPEHLKGRQRRIYSSHMLYDLMSEMMFATSDYKKTLFQSLIEASTVHGSGHPIIEDTERREITYRGVLTRSFILGKALAKEIPTGNYVGVMLPSTTGALITFFALHAYGRVPALLNFSAGLSNLLSACRVGALTTIVTSRRFVEAANLTAIIAQLSEKVTILYLEDLRQRIPYRDKLKGIIAGYFPCRAYKKTAPLSHYHDPAVVLYTSGSEGVPKGVVLTHENIQANRFQAAARIDFNAQDVVFNALPLFHSFGLTAGTLLPLLSGIKIFFYPSPLHYRIIPELIYDVNATIVFGTDTFLVGYGENAHPYDFYSVRYVFAGAEKLKDSTRKLWIEKFGIRVFEGYGITETSPVLSVNTPMHYKVGTVGRLLPGIDFRLSPVPGIDIGGRLFVKGPNILSGYLHETNPGVLQPLPASEYGEGWYDTGDIVMRDDEGFIAIIGRAKRFAKVGGEMISLTAVEEFVASNWPEGMHAVVSKEDEQKGERLILMTTNSNITKDALRNAAKARGVSMLALPSDIMVLGTIPLLGSGKVDYVKLKGMV